jgi:hypothetical protein
MSLRRRWTTLAYSSVIFVVLSVVAFSASRNCKSYKEMIAGMMYDERRL